MSSAGTSSNQPETSQSILQGWASLCSKQRNAGRAQYINAMEQWETRVGAAHIQGRHMVGILPCIGKCAFYCWVYHNLDGVATCCDPSLDWHLLLSAHEHPIQGHLKLWVLHQQRGRAQGAICSTSTSAKEGVAISSACLEQSWRHTYVRWLSVPPDCH